LDTRNVISHLLILAGLAAPHVGAQGIRPPVSEGFDGSIIPALPPGWTASQARDPGGDFTSTTSGALSPPVSVISTNSTVEQWISLPALDLTDWRDVYIGWNERRSATQNSALAVDVSFPAGEPFLEHGILAPTGTTDIVPRIVGLPVSSWGGAGVRVRLRSAGDGTGAAGTLRLDDIVVGGTPARDLAVSISGTHPDPSPHGGPVRLTGIVRNAGFMGVPEATVSCFSRLPGADDPGEWMFQSSAAAGPLLPGEAASVEFSIDRGTAGRIVILLVCASEGDLVASNDSAIATILPPAPRGSVVINEIMFAPLAGRAEYVELLNTTGEEIDLGSWSLRDGDDDSGRGRLGPGALPLAPGGYLLCSPDTTLSDDYPGVPPGQLIVSGLRGLTLNNGGDEVVLADPGGHVVDSLAYLPSWHTPALDDPVGRSLEKIDPFSPGEESWNWGSSPDPSGGTPGRPNLLGNPASHGRRMRFSCHPNPFSPDGDGSEDATVISFVTGRPGAVVRVRIFDRAGRHVRTITQGSYVGEEGSVVWNGYDEGGKKAGIGIYVVLVEVLDGSGEEVFVAKGTVVVAGRL
jgi:hypothetical protein